MMQLPRQGLSPFALGATLYMPAIRPDLPEVLRGRKYPALRSLVLCLEDALSEADVERGIANIRAVLEDLARAPAVVLDTPPRRPLVFLRPRHVAMAAELPERLGPLALSTVDGMVAPKMRAEAVRLWAQAMEGTPLCLMPTLETAEIFDPAAVADLRDALLAELAPRILALRIGGNDLLSCLGLRRARGSTLYEGPLAYVVAMLTGMLVPAGFALTAPVFEILDDPQTLAAEVARDVEFGLVGKTAIHPTQLSAIHAAFRVTRADRESAAQILASDSAAVFQLNGAMCEPATHRNWARRILERAETFGIRDEIRMITN